MKLLFTPKQHYFDLTNKLIKKIDKEYRIYEHEKKEFDNLPKKEQPENKELKPDIDDLKQELKSILKFELKLINDKSAFIKVLIWILLSLSIAVICSHFAFYETKFEPVNDFIIYFSGTMAILFFIFSYLFPEKANSYYKDYINLILENNIINDIVNRENLITSISELSKDVLIRKPKEINATDYSYSAKQKVLLYQIMVQTKKLPILDSTKYSTEFAIKLTGISKRKYQDFIKINLTKDYKKIRDQYKNKKTGEVNVKAIENVINDLEHIKKDFIKIGFLESVPIIDEYIDAFNLAK